MAYGQYYVAQPQGIDLRWKSAIEVYFYLLYTPHERYRIQADINRLWNYRRKPVPVIHSCTSEIRLLPNTKDEEFVKQLLYLLQWEGITREQLLGN